MTAINSQAASLPAKPGPTRAAWREEMLGQLLSSMREHKNPEPKAQEIQPAEIARPAYGKGHYVDLYV